MNPDIFKTQFNHVYIIVTPVSQDGGKEATRKLVFFFFRPFFRSLSLLIHTLFQLVLDYKIEVAVKGLSGFMPLIPTPSVLPVDEAAKWILLKCVNGEVSAMLAKDLRLKMKRTRVQTLESWNREHAGSSHDSVHILNRKK